MSLTIETDLKDIFVQFQKQFEQMDRRFERIEQSLNDLNVGQTEIKGQINTLDERLTGQINTLDERLTGQINILDKRLTGQINTLDEKLTGQIKTLDAKVDGLSTRVGNQEFISRAVLGGLIIIILGGGISMFATFIPIK